MEQKTLDMFVSTCNYLNFLIDDIMSSNSETQSEAFTSANAAIVVNDLMSKLFGFMNHICRNQSVGVSRGSTNVNLASVNSVSSNPGEPTVPPTNVFRTSTNGVNNQLNSPQHSNKNNLVSNSGYNNPSGAPVNFNSDNSQSRMNSNQSGVGRSNNASVTPPVEAITSNYLTNRPLGIDQEKIRLVPSQTTSAGDTKQKVAANNKDEMIPKKAAHLNHVENKPLAKKEKITSADSNNVTAVKLPQKHVDNKPPVKEEKKIIPCDIYVTKLFLGYTDAILEGAVTPNNMGIYCRVCDVLCMKPWSEHVNRQDHVDKKSNLKKLKMYSCRICRICLYGSKNIILKYFEYHFNKIHCDKTDLCWEESLIETECIDSSKNSSKASSVSSLKSDLGNAIAPTSKATKKKEKKNKESVNAVAPTSVKSQQSTTVDNSFKSTTDQSKSSTPVSFTPTESRNSTPAASRCSSTSSIGSKNPSSTSQNEVSTPSKTVSSAPKTVSSAPKTVSSAPIKSADKVTPVSQPNPTPTDLKKNDVPTSPYPAFDYVLDQMKKTYVTSSLRMEVGYCTVCQKCELSYFDWFDHVESHGNATGWNEEICSKCGIHVFGTNHKMYFSLPGHLHLDKIMNKS